MKRKWYSIFLLFFLLSLLLCTPALAEGDGNIDSGEGEMGEGTGENYWNSEDGVRITVIKLNGTKVACFDWSDYNESTVQISFVKRSKLDYRHGYSLTMTYDNYACYTPDTDMPKIVSGSGNDIEEIKRYFTDTGHLGTIASQAGLTYDELVSGEYKILLEPMAYFVYNGIKYAMTAHEAALYDIQVGRDLYDKMARLTHQNLPLAMFLENDDISIGLHKPPSGFDNSRIQSNDTILNYLGMGIISFDPPPEEEEDPVDPTPDPEDPSDPGDYDYVFRCDTDVIVSFPIHNSGEDITPDDDAYVTLNVGDVTYHRQFVCPAGETQLIWVKWHTPSTPQTLTVTASGAGSNVSLSVNVVALEENTPPDPTYYDTGNDFTLAATPNYGSNLRTTWGEWFAEWIQEHGRHYNPIYGWVDGDPDPETGEPTQSYEIIGWTPWYYTCTDYCQEHGYWEWTYVSYYAALNFSFELEPDDRCPTDYETARYGTVMASGYGVQATVTTSVIRGTGVDTYDVTPIQNVIATFPEFGYQTYSRLLEETRSGRWQFQSNPCSYYGSRIHFTPLWYPDDTYYPVAVCAFDAWTPGGQLYVSGKDMVYIYMSALDDWYIHIVE